MDIKIYDEDYNVKSSHQTLCSIGCLLFIVERKSVNTVNISTSY